MSIIRNFSNTSYAGLNFSNISVSEDSVGTVNSFVGSTLTTLTASNVPTTRSTGFQGLTWSAFSAGALAPGSSTTLTFNYDVTETSSGLGINGLQQAFTVDTQLGTGLTLTAVEYVYDANNNLVAQSTINLANPSATAPLASGDFALSAAFTQLHVQVVVTAAVAANAVVPSAVNFSIIDQGFHQTALPGQAALGDYVWEDANNNGVQDAGETGIAGVTVNLLDSSGHFTGLTTTTDANGHYAFSNLNVGTYEVQFVAPGNYAFSPTGAGTPATDSNPNPTTGISAPVTLVAGQNDTTIDAGMYRPAALGDYVFDDINGNGVQDAGDTGIAGVTVNLLDGSGNFTGISTTTDANGAYSFTGLTPGVYEVQFVAPIDYTFSPALQGGNTALDSNPNPTSGVTGPITLLSGQVDNTIDAGLMAPTGSHDTATAALGDYVWEDANDNGVQDAGETGIAGVTVTLLDGTGNTLTTTTTGANGAYSFTGLTAGVYEVQFSLLNGYAFSPTGAGTPATDSNPDDTTGITDQITLGVGEVNNTIDAGMYRPAALGDFVFQDVNGNGIQDAGDTGISGVTVNLLDATGHATGISTTTDANGKYSFTGLNPGVYEVQFVAPTGTTFSPTGQGSNPALDSNPDSSGVTGPITLVSGQTDNSIDAGIIVPVAPPTGKLGDFVWYDCNGNGIQDYGDTGVAGVTVNLLDSTGDNVLASTVTNSSGYYLFSGLNAGVYEVQFVAPTGKSFTVALAGSNRAIDSNADQTTGVTAPITLAAGQTNLTIDAGLINTPNTAKLGDLVFQDCNGNGIQDAGESGIAGVTVKLLNATGTTVLRTTTTDSTGHYLFSNLAAGTYEVKFVTPTGYSLTKALQGTNTAIDSNPDQSTGVTGPITLAAGQTNLTIDAGMYKPASLGNIVFFDSNGNGIQDGCESGVAGVTVKLLSGDGSTVLGTTTTNYNGQYSFTNLTPGVYEVQFVAPAGKAFTIANAGWNDSVDSDANKTTGITGPITLTCGECDTTVDAGLINAPVAKGSIGDYVFCDSNHNGIQDSGESGIAGVTVKLLNSSGTSVLATTTTNSSGHYLFSNLSAGSYVVQFATPNGYTISPSLKGTNPALDSDANTSTGKTGVISLSAGQTNLTIDAGMYKTTTSGGGGCGGWSYTGDGGCYGNNWGGGWGGSCGDSGWGGSCGSYWGGYGGYSSGNCGGSGSYSGGGNWGCSGWNGSGWTTGWDNQNCGLGELQNICGNVKGVEFTYHHSDCVSSDALSCGVGSTWGHNGNSTCFIQITDKSGDHSWGSTVICQGTLHDGDKISSNSAYDLTNCGGQLYAHIYASQADCQAGRAAIQEITFNCGGARDLYLGQQVGSLCLTGYTGSHGSAFTNW